VIFNRTKAESPAPTQQGRRSLVGPACDLIFLLDQDSGIDASFFAGMMKAAGGLSGAFLIGPKIYEIELQKCMPVIPPR